MKARYYWTHDSTGESCNFEKTVATGNVRCYHCDQPIENGSNCVKLSASDGDVYLLHETCAKDSVDFVV